MSTNKPASGLGRGLQALLGEQAVPVASTGESAPARPGGVREIEIGRIRPNPEQPRVQFTEEAIDELADSIAERGVLQPILLRPHGDGGFEIVAGERRWRAAQRARLHTIPALVREIDDSTAAEIALIENIQREDLNAIEEAEGYRQLIQRHGHTQDNVAKLVHKSRSHVANLLRLLDLPDFVRQSLLRGDISMGHARAVATAPDPEALAKEVIAKGLSVRQTEERARYVKPGAGHDIARASARNAKPVDADVTALERQLGDTLGLRVIIAHNGSKGTVTLHYSSLDQLDMVCQRLSGEPI
ncbi:MAG TPA: ParB/RepB/Spo0J family partition protein [Sphingomicrobium sp.]|nr:ParB/RepB/Spo0J family partition protein [Sphingomicrobium sp.]